jgi:hypothetical protein
MSAYNPLDVMVFGEGEDILFDGAAYRVTAAPGWLRVESVMDYDEDKDVSVELFPVYCITEVRVLTGDDELQEVEIGHHSCTD